MRIAALLVPTFIGVVLAEVESAKSAEPTCPTGMVEASGYYCPHVEQTCLKWLDPDNPGVNGPVQCAEFAPSKCLSERLVLKRFCIDQYEWPNTFGELPQTQTSWLEMRNTCSAAGKRLCTGSEFTFACEGSGMKPYPYGDGYHRDSTVCNIDKAWINPFRMASKLKSDGTRVQTWVERPLSEVDQRERIGSHPRCVSDFGVYDLVGNVDEWVINESGRPFQSGLSGGHWAKGARNRCRPKTVAHNESFKFYETGGRCCKDAKQN